MSNEGANYAFITVSAHIEPHSWIQPHLTKMLIDPQSKMNIKTIDPHLELTPTQGIDYQVLYEQLTELNNAHATMHMQC